MNAPLNVTLTGYGTSSGSRQVWMVWRITRTAVWLRHPDWTPEQCKDGIRYAIKTGKKTSRDKAAIWSGMEIDPMDLQRLRNFVKVMFQLEEPEW